MAAQAYHLDATYLEAYRSSPERKFIGRHAIERLFIGFFAEVLPKDLAVPVDLNFRFVQRIHDGDVSDDRGVYRLRIGNDTFFGQFATRVQNGLFLSDRSSDATLADFERAPGGVLFAADEEELAADFFDRQLGAYVDEGGQGWVITRSARRLFARHITTGDWRGLNRVSGDVWTAGSHVLDTATKTTTFRFSANDDAADLFVERAGEAPRQLRRRRDYRLEPVTFASKAAVLGGHVYVPLNADRPCPAIALTHGSGPQDRHGYASIMGVLADHLARLGMLVLTFDKRGVGASTGDWSRATFDDLATDVAQAVALLRGRADVDPERVGIGGSSQAGWVAAAAVGHARPAFVVLLGAAGAGLTVETQNLYNTRIRLACAGVSEADIALALLQQQAYFQARRDPSHEHALVALTRRAAGRPAIQPELFPGTLGERATAEWFDVLDVDFDPLPIWAAFNGSLFLLFGSHDDSTPTDLVQQRLASLPPDPQRAIVVLAGTNHLGLLCETTCLGEPERVSRFHPQLFSTLTNWISTQMRP